MNVNLLKSDLSFSDKMWAFLMPIFSIGPTIYPSLSLRCEHLSIILFFSFYFIKGIRIVPSLFVFSFVGIFFSFALTGLLFDAQGYVLVKELFNVSKLILVFIVLVSIFNRLNEAQILKFVNISIVSLFLVGIVNLILQISNAFGYFLEIVPLFVGSGDEIGRVWKSSYSMGRYCGFFPQPLNAGFFIGLFLFYFVYFKKGVMLYFALIIGVLSGILGASKVAYLGILIAGCLLFKKKIQYVFLAGVVGLVAIIVLSYFESSNIRVFSSFFAEGTEINTSSLTAGRLGSDSTLGYALSCVWSHGGVLGCGAGTLSSQYDMPYDNDFIYMFANGGFLGTLFWCLAFFALFLLAKKNTDFLFLVMFLFLAGLGGVVFSGNGCVYIEALLLVFFYNRLSLNSNARL